MISREHSWCSSMVHACIVCLAPIEWVNVCKQGVNVCKSQCLFARRHLLATCWGASRKRNSKHNSKQQPSTTPSSSHRNTLQKCFWTSWALPISLECSWKSQLRGSSRIVQSFQGNQPVARLARSLGKQSCEVCKRQEVCIHSKWVVQQYKGVHCNEEDSGE